MYLSTKTFTHNAGLSTAFRQWSAVESHCHFLHGYAISIKLTFSCLELDDRNWCVGFGDLKPVKTWLESFFDHKTVVAENDPHLDWFKQGHELGILDLVVSPSVGCEAFAKIIYDKTEEWVSETYGYRVTLEEVEVREHESNSAVYRRDE
jgi:6-pyruvoyltetrahydropterin/6-carboxytetrahydropterin synthase